MTACFAYAPRRASSGRRGGVESVECRVSSSIVSVVTVSTCDGESARMDLGTYRGERYVLC